MIALTGAGGFVGSVILGYLNRQGIKDVYCFDDLPDEHQFKNLIGKQFLGLHSTKEIITDFESFDCVIHCGANSNTLEKNWTSLYETNILSSRRWHDLCREYEKKFIFTSSAAVYGNGSGPLNQYAFSKLISEQEISNGVILRLFNVYGPNEYHKGRMASTPYHWYHQLSSTEKLEIFHDSEKFHRDFIYVEDVAKTVLHFVNNYQEGIYDLGTGKRTNFRTLGEYCVNSFGSGNIIEIPMPDDLQKQYQKDTCADIDYLKSAGVEVENFRSVDQGIKEYYEYLKFSQYY